MYQGCKITKKNNYEHERTFRGQRHSAIHQLLHLQPKAHNNVISIAIKLVVTKKAVRTYALYKGARH